jgi:hypothetical protein
MGWFKSAGGVGAAASPLCLRPDPEASELFSKAYGPVLRQLLEELHQRMTTRGSGGGSTFNGPPPHGAMAPPARRARGAAQSCEIGSRGTRRPGRTRPAHWYLHHPGLQFPLSAVMHGHPEICHLADYLLTELAGVPVQEQCNRTEKVRWCFVVATA